MGLFDWFRTKPECPIDSGTREWIDRRWKWLEEQFGAERVRKARVILPRPEFFPDPFHNTAEDALLVFGKVCDYMGVDPEQVELILYQDDTPTFDGELRSGTAGLYEAAEGHFRIWVEVSNLHDPLAMVATMAHELAHIHLLGHGRVSQEESDHELLTDLLTVFLGLGVFTANSVIRDKYWDQGNVSGWNIGRQGYLTMPEYGYAFARFARCRGETKPPWARELRRDVRTAFHDAAVFLMEVSAQNQTSEV